MGNPFVAGSWRVWSIFVFGIPRRDATPTHNRDRDEAMQLRCSASAYTGKINGRAAARIAPLAMSRSREGRLALCCIKQYSSSIGARRLRAARPLTLAGSFNPRLVALHWYCERWCGLVDSRARQLVVVKSPRLRRTESDRPSSRSLHLLVLLVFCFAESVGWRSIAKSR